MSKRKTALANKARGRAFQTKLAEMTGGMNIGTLGGEDVMHEEFSYEAKTYNKNCATHKGKNWKGEDFLSWYDRGLASNKLVVITIKCSRFEDLVLLRFSWWKDLLEGKISHTDLAMSGVIQQVPTFKGDSYMRQAEGNCPDAKVPVVVVHTTGRRHDQDIVMVRSIYWESLLDNLFTFDKSL